jgi:hypothetical protein
MDTKNRRSRSDPSISLREAVEKISILYEKESRNDITFSLAMKHLGYKPKSGPGIVLIADMRKYGLLEYKGAGPNKMVVVSGIAESILHPGSPTKSLDLQKAALMPLIHADLWENHRRSTDENISYYLTTKRNYSEKAAKALIKRYRETIDFAGLSKDIKSEVVPKVSEEVTSNGEGEMTARVQPAETDAKPSAYTLYASLGINKQATAILPTPMTMEKWERIKAIFDAQIKLILEETDQKESK